MALPPITVVIPNFNGGTFLEQAVVSVSKGGLRSCECVVIDGGSTDGSVDIIRRHAAALACWESEKDRGQTHAINKGFRKTKGEIVGWINSDDYLLPHSLRHVADAFEDPRVDWVVGNAIIVDEDGAKIRDATRIFKDSPETWFEVGKTFALPQQASFWRRNVFDKVGMLREDMHYAFDYEFWLRMLTHGYRPHFIDQFLGAYRFHSHSKTTTSEPHFWREIIGVWETYIRHCPQQYMAKIRRLIEMERLDIAVKECARKCRTGSRLRAAAGLAGAALAYPRHLPKRLLWGSLVKCVTLGRIEW